MSKKSKTENAKNDKFYLLALKPCNTAIVIREVQAIDLKIRCEELFNCVPEIVLENGVEKRIYSLFDGVDFYEYEQK